MRWNHIVLKISRISVSGLLLCISFHLLRFAVEQAFAQIAETGLLYGNRLLDRARDPGEIVWVTWVMLHASTTWAGNCNHPSFTPTMFGIIFLGARALPQESATKSPLSNPLKAWDCLVSLRFFPGQALVICVPLGQGAAWLASSKAYLVWAKSIHLHS